MRIHYNYCRQHSQLGKTPIEQAGIKLEFETNRIESLLRIVAVRFKKDDFSQAPQGINYIMAGKFTE